MPYGPLFFIQKNLFKTFGIPSGFVRDKRNRFSLPKYDIKDFKFELKTMSEKITIYQVLPRLFGNTKQHPHQDGTIKENGCGKFSSFTNEALSAIREMGFSHIWYTGIIEHATQTDYSRQGIAKDHKAVVKGKAGSPYAIKDYYDVDPDLADKVPNRMQEFEALVKRTHDNGMKVIIDFVPNHVARQYHSDAKREGIADLGENDDVRKAFSPNNNFYYIPDCKLEGAIDLQQGEKKPYIEFPAKATGNNRFDQWPCTNDWYETVKLNYGVDYCNGGTCYFDPIPDTWNKMLDILLFWSAKNIDGFRCDMAEMVPVEFWEWVVPQIKEKYPEILFIAEVYNPNEYWNYINRGKFDYLYDKVGLYDTLKGVTLGDRSASQITHCWQNLGDCASHMLNFMENHDEQRLASDFLFKGGLKAKPAVIVSSCINNNPFMLYFGQELGEMGMDCEGFSGQDGRTTIFDYWTINSIYRWRNGGKFNEDKLTANEKKVRSFYTKLLSIIRTEKAISDGQFFDVMYVNQGSWTFNDYKHYCFLRKYENELLVIVANFDGMKAKMGVNLPMHAFDYLNLPKDLGKVTATDLLTGKEEKLSIVPDHLTNITVDAYNGKILKITF